MTVWKPISTAPKDRLILLKGKHVSGGFAGEHIASAKWLENPYSKEWWEHPAVPYEMKWSEWAEIPE